MSVRGQALDHDPPSSARVREVLAGLNFSQERMDGDVGLLSGGWKMRVALARILHGPHHRQGRGD
jgi:ATPase subunit of ABC transporter with duplicated ATPase domains